MSEDKETAIVKTDQPQAQAVKLEQHDIFALFDSLDDKAIMDEIEGRIVKDCVYHFNQQGQEIWGIGKQGVDLCVNELGKKGIVLRDEDVSWTLDPTNPQFVLFKAKVHKHYVAKDGGEAEVETAIGTKRQWVKIKRKYDQKIIDNPFWFEQGSQKAIRNARLRLIPEDIKQKIILFAKEGGKVKEITVEDIKPLDGKAADDFDLDGAGTKPPTPEWPEDEGTAKPAQKEMFANGGNGKKEGLIKAIKEGLTAEKVDEKEFKTWLLTFQEKKERVYVGLLGKAIRFHSGKMEDLEELYRNLMLAVKMFKKAKEKGK